MKNERRLNSILKCYDLLLLMLRCVVVGGVMRLFRIIIIIGLIGKTNQIIECQYGA